MRDINIKNVNRKRRREHKRRAGKVQTIRGVVFFSPFLNRVPVVSSIFERVIHSARKKKNSYDNAREKRSKRVEMTTKKKEDNDAKKGGNSYEVDAKYSFKDLVSVSPPSWQLFSGNGRDDDDVKEDKKEEKKTKKERTPTKPSMSLNVAIEDEERRKTPIKKKALMTSTSKALSMKPKLGKMSFVDAFFLPGELERVKRKSREWGAAAWSARGDTTKDEDFEEVRRKRDIQKQLLSEWHQTVEKFRDDYKAKRKAAVRRSKRLGGKVFDF